MGWYILWSVVAAVVIGLGMLIYHRSPPEAPVRGPLRRTGLFLLLPVKFALWFVGFPQILYETLPVDASGADEEEEEEEEDDGAWEEDDEEELEEPNEADIGGDATAPVKTSKQRVLTKISLLFRNDIMFTFCVLMPIIVGAWHILPLLWNILFLQVKQGDWFGLIGLLYIGAGLLILYVFHPYVEQDKMGVRMFLWNQFFTSCRPFVIKWFSKLILIPGAPVIEWTAKKQGEAFSVYSQVRQRGSLPLKQEPASEGTPKEEPAPKQADDADGDSDFLLTPMDEPTSGVEPETPKGKRKKKYLTDRQFVVLKVVYRLDIFRNPHRVVENFLQYFLRDYKEGKPKFDSMHHEVKERILEIIAARTDEVLQRFYIEQLLVDVKQANKMLFRHMEKVLAVIGVQLIQITIEDIQDVGNDGYIAQLRRRTNAVQKSKADQVVSTQEANARVVDAQQNLRGKQEEMRTRELSAKAQELAVAAEVKVAEQEALRKLEPLKQELLVLKDQENRSALLSAKLSELGSTQMEAILVQFAKSLGLNVEHGGNITFTSVAGDPVRFHPGMAASEIIKTLGDMFNLYMKGENPKP